MTNHLVAADRQRLLDQWTRSHQTPLIPRHATPPRQPTTRAYRLGYRIGGLLGRLWSHARKPPTPRYVEMAVTTGTDEASE